MRRIRLARTVIKIPRPHDFGREPEPTGDPRHNFLDHEHALRPAKSAKRRVRRHVRLRDPTREAHRGNEVRVVQVKQRTVTDRLRKIHRPPAVGNEFHLRAEQAALAIVADLKLRPKRMPLSRERHVDITVQLPTHGPSGLQRRERDDRRRTVALRFLAAKTAAHAR